MTPYQWNATDYAKSSSGQQRWARELISKLALTGDEWLLDVGCGDGKVTAEIAARLPRGSALGVDNSADMIALARHTYPTEVLSNLRFEQHDARSLPFENEFDVVFSNAALHWVLDHAPVLRGIQRSLRPGGKALLQMGGRGNAADVIAALGTLITAEAWRGFFEAFTFPYGFYGPEEYTAWLCDAGLRAVRVELLPKDMVHADRGAFEGWFRTTWLPYTQQVPEDRRTAFTGQLVNAYLAHCPPDEQGAVHVNMVRLEVEAVKLF